ncbi:MAG: N-acetylmuramoyl-L-alanine amidase [Saprospiraceae bacterium]
MVSNFPQIINNVLKWCFGITLFFAILLQANGKTPVKITIKSNNATQLEFINDAIIDKKVKKIVIDAGHGGHDPGCKGDHGVEKDLTLAMALKTADLIKSKYADVEVLLTRNTDVFIPLFRRIQYANEENADLFISIHCNFISNANTKGTETFVMGLHRADENLDVAKRENASILLESNFEKNYDGYNPNSPEGHIMMSMYQNAYLDKSIAFAADVENNFKGRNGFKSRGVKQAGFAVLRRASMPAVLIEAGFLSNDEEEKYLISEEGQNDVARAILSAFDTFYNSTLKQSDIISKAQISQQVEENISVWGVQIAAVKEQNSTIESPLLNKFGNLNVIQSGDYYKYVMGYYKTKEEAASVKAQLTKMGYKGTFIVSKDKL